MEDSFRVDAEMASTAPDEIRQRISDFIDDVIHGMYFILYKNEQLLIL